MTSQSEKPTRRNLWLALAPLAVFAALAVMFVVALNSGDPSRLPSALVGKNAPKTSFDALTGLERNGAPVPGFTSDQLAKGRISIVNFWASWCGPCIIEHPQIVELAKRDDIDVYGVNYKDAPSDARRFLTKHGNPFFALGVDPSGRGAIEWGVSKMPESFIVGPNGKIIYKHAGPISPQDLASKIIPAIASAKSAN